MRCFKIIVVSLFFLNGCYDKIAEEGDKLYNEKKYHKAVDYYERYIKLNSKKRTPQLEEVIYKTATIYNLYLSRCDNSKRYFELLIRTFPNTKYKDEATFRSIFCPNYIYPQNRRYVLGDSQSYGKNAREVISIIGKSFSEINFISEIYAGKKLISRNRKKYVIRGMDVFEKNTHHTDILIKYPVEDGARFEYHNSVVEIKRVDSVEVKAGVFTNCIAVKRLIKGTNIGNIYYMAPEIGKILITSYYESSKIYHIIF